MPGATLTTWCCAAVAEEIGVIGVAEMASYTIKEDTAFLILATDGVWEFLTSQTVVDLVRPCQPICWHVYLALQHAAAVSLAQPGDSCFTLGMAMGKDQQEDLHTAATCLLSCILCW
jgi:Protein phosphatase 2C